MKALTNKNRLRLNAAMMCQASFLSVGRIKSLREEAASGLPVNSSPYSAIFLSFIIGRRRAHCDGKW